MAQEKEQDTVAHEAAVEWDPEVAALIGPGMAQYEAMRGKILSPEERLVFLAGYCCCQDKTLDALEHLREILEEQR